MYPEQVTTFTIYQFHSLQYCLRDFYPKPYFLPTQRYYSLSNSHIEINLLQILYFCFLITYKERVRIQSYKLQ